MSDIILYSVLGLSAGAVYAAIAQALVAGYRGSGVVNFAQGAMAMFVSYVYFEMRVEGRVMVPPLPNPLSLIEGVGSWFGADLHLPDLPTFIDLGGPVNAPVAFVASLAVAVLMGFLVHVLVFNPLRDAPPVSKVIASVGLLLALQAVVALRHGTEPRTVPAVLPRRPVNVLGTVVTTDRLLLAGIVVVISVVLAGVYRRTRFGAATEAAASNERGAILSGLAPQRLAAANWIVSSVVGGAVGILFASVTGLEPTNYTLYVIPALGAALIGGFGSFLVAAAAGFGIGITQSLAVFAQGRYTWFPDVGAAEGIPFLAIIITMIVRGSRLPVRGSFSAPRLPASPEPARVWQTALIAAPIAAVGLVYLPYDLRSGLIASLIGTLMALSLVVIAGMAGQVSLMQVAVAGAAALAMTRLAGDWGVPFPLAPLLAAAAAALLGLVASIPALRVRGVHLAITTLGAAAAFHAMVLRNGDFLRTGDAVGAVPSPSLFGVGIGINGEFPLGPGGAPSAGFGLLVLVVVVLLTVAVANLRRNSTGRQFLAIRSNERAAAALGVNVASTKIVAFTVAGFLAGLAGSLDAYRFQGVTADQYVPLASAFLLAVVYLGGLTTISGALFAGLLTVGGLNSRILERLFHAGEFETLLAGVGLLVIAVTHPEGMAGVARNAGAHFRHRHRPSPATRTPSRVVPRQADSRCLRSVRSTSPTAASSQYKTSTSRCGPARSSG